MGAKTLNQANIHIGDEKTRMLWQIFFLNYVEQEQTFALGSVRIFNASDSSWKSSAAEENPELLPKLKCW